MQNLDQYLLLLAAGAILGIILTIAIVQAVAGSLNMGRPMGGMNGGSRMGQGGGYYPRRRNGGSSVGAMMLLLLVTSLLALGFYYRTDETKPKAPTKETKEWWHDPDEEEAAKSPPQGRLEEELQQRLESGSSRFNLVAGTVSRENEPGRYHKVASSNESLKADGSDEESSLPAEFYIQTAAGQNRSFSIEEARRQGRRYGVSSWIGTGDEAYSHPYKVLVGPFDSEAHARTAMKRLGLKGMVKNVREEGLSVSSVE